MLHKRSEGWSLDTISFSRSLMLSSIGMASVFFVLERFNVYAPSMIKYKSNDPNALQIRSVSAYTHNMLTLTYFFQGRLRPQCVSRCPGSGCTRQPVPGVVERGSGSESPIRKALPGRAHAVCSVAGRDSSIGLCDDEADWEERVPGGRSNRGGSIHALHGLRNQSGHRAGWLGSRHRHYQLAIQVVVPVQSRTAAVGLTTLISLLIETLMFLVFTLWWPTSVYYLLGGLVSQLVGVLLIGSIAMLLASRFVEQERVNGDDERLLNGEGSGEPFYS